MSSTKSPLEIEEEMVTKLGEINGRLFYGIQNEFIHLTQKYKHFEVLFMKGQSRIDIMNRTASYFFFSIQRIMLDDLVINISRLTEAKSEKKNATIKLFLDSYNRKDLDPQINKLEKKFKESFKNLINWRNKRVAHRDFDIHVNQSPISLKYDEVKTCITDLTSLMRRIHINFFGSDYLYDLFSVTGGATSLLAHLDYSLRSREEYYKSQSENRQFDIDKIRPGKKGFE